MFPAFAIIACVAACAATDGPAVTLILIGMLVFGWTMQNFRRA